MNEFDFRTNTNEGSAMLHTKQPNYRQAFWIAVITTVGLAIVASVLWWRLAHAGAASKLEIISTSRSMDAMAPTVPSRTTGAGETQTGDNTGDSPCANSAHPSANAEHRHGAWEG